WTVDHCVAYGDPVDGRLVIIRTTDGRSWTRVPADRMPAPMEGEAGFAASGTTLTLAGDSLGWIGTGGGAHARVLITTDGGASWTATDTPLPANGTSGIFGIAFRDAMNGVAVGGDYQRRTEEQQNVIRTRDGGHTWSVAGATLPHGVRYGAAYGTGGVLLAVGPSGAGFSHDDGATWTALDDGHWNTLAFAPNGDAWLAGPDGRIAHVPAGALVRSGAAGREYPTNFDPRLLEQAGVRDAIAWIESDFEQQVQEWIRITEIPGTSRHEQQRAEYVKAQLEAEGLIVTIDSIGNVIARRPGTGLGETVVFAAH